MAFGRKQQPLEERLSAIKEEIDAYISARANEEYERMGGGVPLEMIRHVMTGRAGCLCNAFAAIRKVEEQDAEIAARQADERVA
jgi:hypothetical protein